MQGRTITTAAAIAAAWLLTSSSTALGAGPGETFPSALIPLPAGAIAGGASGHDDLDYPRAPAVSADGRYVAFIAAADLLVADAPLDTISVFRKDRATGDVVLVSRADGVAGTPALDSADDVTISDDGSRVAWVTNAPLDPTDGDGTDDVYVRDLTTSQTLLPPAFAASSQSVSSYDLSGDGNWIAFISGERLAPGDANTHRDIYRAAVTGGGATTLVSAVDGGTAAGNAYAYDPAISGDGTWVAFASTATDLTAGFVDGNTGGGDVYARDVTAGRTYLVSNASALVRQSGNESSSSPVVAGSPTSGGGTNVTIAYTSFATDLAPAGTDLSTSLSVYRRNLGPRFSSSALVSRAAGPTGANAGASAYLRGVSDDGRLVVFSSNASNLGVAGQDDRAYVRDTAASTTVLGSVVGVFGSAGTISGDGSLFVWGSGGGITADSDPDATGVFARAYATPPAVLGAPELVSRPVGSAPFLLPALWTESADPGERAISGDGRYVLLSGYTHRDLVGLGDLGVQLYRRDTQTGAFELASRANGPGGAAATGPVIDRSISADGRRVVFSTYAALDPSDTDTDADVYLRDFATATTTLVSRADGVDGDDADSDAQGARISAVGTHVTFATTATNLGTPGVTRHVYLRDVAAGRTTVVDRATGAGGILSDRESEDATLSADGRLVAFVSRGTNLDPADPGPSLAPDVYVRDTVAGTTVLVSRRSGADGQKAATGGDAAVLSADGRTVAFTAYDETLAPEAGAWGRAKQVVARDLATQQNTLVSRAPVGAAADADANAPSISDDGGTVAFASEATNLLAGAGGTNRTGVFARTMATGALGGPPPFGRISDMTQFGAVGPSVSGDGQCLAFTATGHNAVSGFAGDQRTAYVHVLSGSCPKALPPARREQPQPRTQEPPGTLPKPALTKVSLLRARFRVGKGATAVAAAARRPAKRKPAPAGTAVRFTLNARANVSIAIERKGTGRKVGKQCRRATSRLRRKPACTRWEKAGALVRKGVDPGRRSVAFSGRVGRRALAPGSYRAVVSAANAAGSSRPATLAFTVVRR